MNEIKHFKLSNGDEVVCDVVEWPDIDGDSPDIVVRNCFKIVTCWCSKVTVFGITNLNLG
jgi:hypothetical protein